MSTNNNDTIPCASCGEALLKDSFGLDTYDEGYSILPEGKFRLGDAVCLSCYEKEFSSCEVCERTVELESGEGEENVGGVFACGDCAAALKARVLKFSSYSGVSWEEDFMDEEDASKALHEFIKEQEAKGRTIVVRWSKDGLWPTGAEVLEPEDSALVPDWAGVLSMEPAPIPLYWTRTMRKNAGR
jgi:hypothetical protein